MRRAGRDHPARAENRVAALGRVGLLPPDLRDHLHRRRAASRQAQHHAHVPRRLDRLVAGHRSVYEQCPRRFSLFPASGVSFHAIQRAALFDRRNRLARLYIWPFYLRVDAAERLLPRGKIARACAHVSHSSRCSPCRVPSPALRNAQFDLPLAALVVLATAEAAAARWSTAALWLCLGVAFKPLAVVPLLLFSALYWKLIPRVAVGLLIVAAIPFLHWSPSFVAQEYRRCFETLAWASAGRRTALQRARGAPGACGNHRAAAGADGRARHLRACLSGPRNGGGAEAQPRRLGVDRRRAGGGLSHALQSAHGGRAPTFSLGPSSQASRFITACLAAAGSGAGSASPQLVSPATRFPGSARSACMT